MNFSSPFISKAKIYFIVSLFTLCNNVVTAQHEWEWLVSSTSPSQNMQVTDISVDSIRHFVYISGHFEDLNPSLFSITSKYTGRDGFIAKYDFQGNEIWSYAIGGSGNDAVMGIDFGTDSCVYFTGYYALDLNMSSYGLLQASDGGPRTEAYFIKLNDVTGQISGIVLESTDNISGQKICYYNNELYVAGHYSDDINFTSALDLIAYDGVGTTVPDVFVGKVDISTASFVWSNNICSNSEDYIYDLDVDENHVYIAGASAGDRLYTTNQSVNSTILNTDGYLNPYLAAFSTANGSARWGDMITESNPGGGSSATSDWFSGVHVNDSGVYVVGSVMKKYPDATFPAFQSSYTFHHNSSADVTVTPTTSDKYSLVLARYNLINPTSFQLGEVNSVNLESSSENIYGSHLDDDGNGNLVISGFGNNASTANYNFSGTTDIFLSKYDYALNFNANSTWDKVHYGTGEQLNSAPVRVATFNNNVAFAGGTIADVTTFNTFTGGEPTSDLGFLAMVSKPLIATQDTLCTLLKNPSNQNIFVLGNDFGESLVITQVDTSVHADVFIGGTGNFIQYNPYADTAYIQDSIMYVVQDSYGNLDSAWLLVALVPVDAGDNDIVCSNTFTLNGSSPGGMNVGTWSVTSGAATITNVNDENTSVNVSSFPVEFTWTITNPMGCSVQDQVQFNSNNSINFLVNPLPDLSFQCATSGTISPPKAENFCGDTIVATTTTSFPITTQGSYTVTWTYNLPFGGTTTQNQNIVIDDNTAPIVLCQDTTIWLNGSGTFNLDESYLEQSSSDNCGIDSTYTNIGTLTCTDVGSFTDTLFAVDLHGNTSYCLSQITVVDSISPVITSCPADITITADVGNCFATGVTLGTLTATDNCSFTITNDSLASYPVGITTVTWKVTDASGNITTCTQQITVTDNELPSITCPAAQTFYVDNNCFVINPALTAPATSDNCGVQSVTNDALASYGVGSYTITHTVLDINGNNNSCTQSITVLDAISPVIDNCPLPVISGSDAGLCGATSVNLGNLNITENCSFTVVNDAPTIYPIGITTVTWTVSDPSGNSATCSQQVNIFDTEVPSITCPTSQTFYVNTTCTINSPSISTPTASDNCGIASITNNAQSVLSPGNYTLIHSAIDLYGNTNSCSQSITVIDTISPTVICNDTTVYLDQLGFAIVDSSFVEVALIDNCTLGTVTMNVDTLDCSDIGQINDILFAEDIYGNSSYCTFQITVVDTLQPTVNCVPDTTLYLNDDGMVLIDPTFLEVTSTDNCAGLNTFTNIDTLLCSHIGTFSDTLFAIDASGNTNFCLTQITVLDSISPVLICPNDTSIYLSNSGCDITYGIPPPSVSDNCGISSYTEINNVTAGDVLPIGDTLITYEAIDFSGNLSTCNFTVYVEDTIAPIIICPSDTIICDSIADFQVPVATDNCSLKSLTQIAGPLNGDVLAPGLNTVMYEAEDFDGNTSVCSFHLNRIIVPDPNWLGLPEVLCESASPILLDSLVTNSTSGIFAGNGISGNYFDPQVAGVGTHFVSYTIIQGICFLDSNDVIEIVPAPVAYAGEDDSICGLNYDMNAQPTPNGFWTNFSSTISVPDFTDPYTQIQETEFGNVALIWNTDTTIGCDYSDTVIIRFDELPQNAYAGENQAILDGLNYFLQPEDPTIGYGVWSSDDAIDISDPLINNALITAYQPGSYTLVFTIYNGACTPRIDEVVISFLELTFPQGISPNADGYNDTFEIRGIEFYDQKRLVIFNRLGKIIYESMDYNNDWNGLDLQGRAVENGTYFFELELNEIYYSGFIVLER